MHILCRQKAVITYTHPLYWRSLYSFKNYNFTGIGIGEPYTESDIGNGTQIFKKKACVCMPELVVN